jgi:YYY domain-containing protein
MFELFQMWALVEVLGMGCLPLTYAVFHNLPDRGWAFSKAVGLVVLAFCVWFLLMCVPVLPFGQQFILGIGLILAACSILAWLRLGSEVAKMVRHNLIYVIAAEIVFLGMVFLLGWVRSFGPDIRSFEMFMDEGIVASIMRSSHFPPNDVWFSGYSINYYYYAHYTIAMLAKFLNQSPSIAFNTGICVFFGLCAVNLFGLTSNVVAWARYWRNHSGASKTISKEPRIALPALLPAIPYGLLSCLMALIFGNLAATRQWWMSHDGASFDLFGFWFNSTRVLSPPASTINEFPAFSFLLSCFHAHVLTLAFTILAMALAFNLLLEAAGKGLRVFGHDWRLRVTLVFTALVLGGLFIMNSWDYPTYMGITLICIVLQQWLAHSHRFSLKGLALLVVTCFVPLWFVLRVMWVVHPERYTAHLRDMRKVGKLLLDVLLPMGVLVGLSLVFYLPFLLNFVSPSQGIGLVTPSLRSLLSDELLIYGLFAFVFLSLVLTSVSVRPLFMRSAQTEFFAEPQAELPADAEVACDVQKKDALNLFSPGFIVSILCIVHFIVCIVVLRVMANSTTFVASSSLALLGGVLIFYHLRNRAHVFALLLGSFAFGLVAACEIVYLRDVFADGEFERMNTVFKFYFQAWILLAVACGIGVFFIIESFRPKDTVSSMLRWLQSGLVGLWSLFFLGLMLASMIYPLNAPYARYARFDVTSQTRGLFQAPNLDGLTYLASDSKTSSDYKAILWLNGHVQGDPGIVEAVGDDYTYYGRISTFTGLSSPMGWVGHEYQWRVVWITKSAGNNAEYQRRASDVYQIYTNADPSVVLALMAHDHVQYLYVGALERVKYPSADLERFGSFMQIVYDIDGVTIYRVM